MDSMARPRCPVKPTFLAAALLLSAGAARAEGPVTPPQGPDPMEEIQKASIRVSKALKESEEALSKIARGERAEPKPVDVDLPKKTAPTQAPEPQPGGGG
jgi:hypothetical protein